jgi:hypothetical protein
MAKAILEFDLNDPDDRREFELVNKSKDIALALWEIVHNTKKSVEWKIETAMNKPDAGDRIDAYDGIEGVYEAIYEILNDRGIKIDDYIY